MKIFVILILIKLAFAGTSLPPFYHTTDEVEAEVKNILKNCQMKATQKKYGIVDSITLKPKLDHENKNKAFLIFGEHARELISVETGLHLLNQICHTPLDFKLKIIINMNPTSRRYVERGHYCLRENLNGVDLNRNYGFEWKFKENHFVQDSSGPEPFSEVETQTVRDILSSFKPKTFITVHSGTLAILHPWAFKKEDVVFSHHHNLRGVKNECVDCLIGGAATQIGYTASGNSMDYAYGMAKVKRSYTLEIFEYEKQNQRKEPDSNFAEFLQHKEKEKSEISNKELFCFDYFNPRSEDQYNELVAKWSNIILQLIQ
ncbi:unnamed protein product (macronuclear) [Paramecium tetraurelia]|uniref:Peptidase M14 domain-containing protein n=1 Tax=Paramecium tetraurelia TaxID=5888 RepID=A0C772_PARTE|nr:uncharacterized protein GSPATT00035769001 [Paramecium tetraurelia]CAK66639.1 unnamed protein product [Paramecium tetraurelia]|eukprot:XP_001434036.1 hypothetical protein (macronuclear) [Paramecium tetraurelia strain d4-2]